MNAPRQPENHYEIVVQDHAITPILTVSVDNDVTWDTARFPTLGAALIAAFRVAIHATPPLMPEDSP